MIGILTAVHVLVALALVFVVLMQKSQDQGVGAAFGGGVTDTVFGAGTTTALVRMTIWCACIMLGTTLLLAVLHSRRGGNQSVMERAAQSAPAAPALPAPAPVSAPVSAPAPTP
jgi:preprotein translocase subunit SecG